MAAFLRPGNTTAPLGADPLGLSVLKPVCGLHPDEATLSENVRSLLSQSYPFFEVLFGFQDASDAALSVIERVCAEFPQVPTRVVRVADAPGPNRKASVLAALEPLARHPVVVVSDQDMRFAPGYLQAVAAPFADERVGVVTCPYRCVQAHDVGGVLEALTVNVDFIPSVTVAGRLEGLSFALGATMAARREAVRAIGGFAHLQRYLADDYQLGNQIHICGWKVHLSPFTVDDMLGATPFMTYFKHQLRWARTYRVCRPGGYFSSVLMHGVAFALGLWLLGWGSKPLLGWLLLRWAVALWNQVLLNGGAANLWWLLMLPLRDVLAFALWVLAWWGDEVEWGGKRYVVSRDGTMRPRPTR
jgi:ceramide glucosyltransferase